MPRNRKQLPRFPKAKSTVGRAATCLECLRLYRGFINQHHRDVVLDWVDAMTLLALQRRLVVD